MTPSSEELAAGQKAYGRLDSFQRQKPVQSLLFVLVVMGSGTWRSFERDGWKMALGITLFGMAIGAIGFYQFQKQKRRAKKSALLLITLKQTYGEQVYSAIEKSPHSIFYNLFVRRYSPFRGRSSSLELVQDGLSGSPIRAKLQGDHESSQHRSAAPRPRAVGGGDGPLGP